MRLKTTTFLITFLYSFYAVSFETRQERVIFNHVDAKNVVQKNYPDIKERMDSSGQIHRDYQRIESIVEKVFAAYKNKLATKITNFPPTPVVLISPSFYGGGGYTPIRLEDGRIGNSNILLFDELSSLSDNEIDSLVAHELAHYILGHTQSGLEDQVISVYDQEQDSCFTCAEMWNPNEEELKEMKTLANDAENIGELLFIDTRGIPINLVDDSNSFGKLLTQMLDDTNEKIDECYQAKNLLIFIKNNIIRNCDHVFQSCSVNQMIKDNIELFKSHAYRCFFKDKNFNFYDSFEKVYQFSPQEVESDLNGNPAKRLAIPTEDLEDLSILVGNVNPFLKVIKLFERSEARAKKSAGHLPSLDRLGFLTIEDEADTLGLIVTMSLQPDMKSDEWFLRDASPQGKDFCKNLAANTSGRMRIHQGFLSDPHHSSCWRFWRSVKVIEELRQNPQDEDRIIELILNNNMVITSSEVGP